MWFNDLVIVQMITREEIDLPDHADITGLDYPPIIELEVVNDDPYPSHHHTECPVQIVGFCRNDLIIDLTLRISMGKDCNECGDRAYK